MKAKEYIFDASYQPQVRAKRGTTNIMLDVIIALMPALIVGIWQFGVRVILYTVLSVASAVFFEWLYRKLMHKNNTIGDLSAALTGLFTVMVLPSSSPWWILLIANLFAIVVVKQLYGGLGKNFLNPALAGRAFVFFSYTLALSNWGVPAGLKASVDAVTMSTPLSLMKAGQALPDYLNYKNMLIGIMPGCIGEVSTIALLVGGIYLLCRKVITWHVPVSFIGSGCSVILKGSDERGSGDFTRYIQVSVHGEADRHVVPSAVVALCLEDRVGLALLNACCNEPAGSAAVVKLTGNGSVQAVGGVVPVAAVQRVGTRPAVPLRGYGGVLLNRRRGGADGGDGGCGGKCANGCKYGSHDSCSHCLSHF